MRRPKDVSQAGRIISHFVSYLRSGRPWFDAHLPLIPIPIRSERPALPNQRLILDFHQSVSREPSEDAIDWSMPPRDYL
jgi:hypothetical protein